MIDEALLQQQLGSAIAADAGELTEFVSSSVRVPSVSGDEAAIGDWYAEWCARAGWDCEKQPLAGSELADSETEVEGRANVIAYPFGRPEAGERVVVLNGHLDVVPPGDEDAWEVPPFSGESVAGRIHGRGTVDMKGGIGSAVFALQALRTVGPPLALKPVLHLVIGEETGGVGTRLALRGLGKPDAAVVLEPTGNELVTICTGLQFFKLETFGRAAHSSAPWTGVDALQRILPLREALIETAERRSNAFQHPRYQNVPTAIPFNIGKFTAGTYQASVPDHAVIVGRIGLHPREEAGTARREFRQAVDRAAAADPDETELPHRLSWLGEEFPAWETPEDAPLVQAFVEALQRTDGAATLKGLTAGSDAGRYGALGVPTVIFGPGEISLAHTTQESVATRDLVRAAHTVALALAALS